MADSSPKPMVADSELIDLFRRTSRLMARAWHRQANAPMAQSRILHLLRERGPVSQRDMLGELDIRSASLSELLAKLEAGGWIARERNPDDRRGFIISATDRTMADTNSGTETTDGSAALFDCLADEERTALRDILTKLTDSLSKECPAGPGFGGGRHGRGRGPGKGFGRNDGRGMGKGRGMGRGRRG
ncbi:MarR family winged helix-turn-helix transcriptional regulator [Pseudodesulfovibrio sp.]|uniref:MarR family winged helix-turn-helix transcriptional regulator n=1 Tax=unclassified Pseudodesulfovibrio TaxID=2661612 RepID=UPI003B00A210